MVVKHNQIIPLNEQQTKAIYYSAHKTDGAVNVTSK